MKLDTQKLYRELAERLDYREMSWRDLSKELGISASTLTRLSQGGTIEISTFAKMCKFLERRMENFICETDE